MTPTLKGSLVTLRPLRQTDARPLVEAATDGTLWSLPFTVIPAADTVTGYIDNALHGEAEGTVMPFAVTLSADQRVIGSTRFWKIDRENRKLEIGYTWYARHWQRTAANTESKLLLLRYAFEQLRCIRVQFTTDVLNERSQAAILRLGAVQEGIIRNELIMPDGRKRSSISYSIIDDEWPAVRAKLEHRLAHHGQGHAKASAP